VTVRKLGAIIARMVAGPRLTLGGFLARFAFAVLVVGATYNPTRYSYYAWLKSTGTSGGLRPCSSASSS
jgi:Family of unknown function (DUF6524)